MRTLLILVCLMIGSWTYAQQSDLIVEVSNISTTDGRMRASLFSKPDSYLKDAEWDADTIIYNQESVQILFKNLPAGEYAISVYHDQNNNGKLDANFMGIPSEPYAFSNNAPSRFGPAKYEDAKFTITDQKTIQKINLN